MGLEPFSQLERLRVSRVAGESGPLVGLGEIRGDAGAARVAVTEPALGPGVADLGGAPEPVRRLPIVGPNPLTTSVEQTEAELGGLVILLGGAAEPPEGAMVVSRHAPAEAEEQREIVLGLGQSRSGRALEPARSVHVIGPHALTQQEHHPEMVLRGRVLPLGRLRVPPPCVCHVLGHTIAVFVEHSEVVLGALASLDRRAPQPVQRARDVAQPDLSAVVKDAQVVLGVGVTATRGACEPREGTPRVLGHANAVVVGAAKVALGAGVSLLRGASIPECRPRLVAPLSGGELEAEVVLRRGHAARRCAPVQARGEGDVTRHAFAKIEAHAEVEERLRVTAPRALRQPCDGPGAIAANSATAQIQAAQGIRRGRTAPARGEAKVRQAALFVAAPNPVGTECVARKDTAGVECHGGPHVSTTARPSLAREEVAESGARLGARGIERHPGAKRPLGFGQAARLPACIGQIAPGRIERGIESQRAAQQPTTRRDLPPRGEHTTERGDDGRHPGIRRERTTQVNLGGREAAPRTQRSPETEARFDALRIGGECAAQDRIGFGHLRARAQHLLEEEPGLGVGRGLEGPAYGALGESSPTQGEAGTGRGPQGARIMGAPTRHASQRIEGAGWTTPRQRLLSALHQLFGPTPLDRIQQSTSRPFHRQPRTPTRASSEGNRHRARPRGRPAPSPRSSPTLAPAVAPSEPLRRLDASLPPEVRDALHRLGADIDRLGGRALAVGGCVRDALLGRPATDVDVEVHGITPDRLTAALAARFRVHRVGRAFPVFKLAGLPIDVAMPRRDSRPGGAVEDAALLTPEEAAARRDFTINAIALDLANGECIDPFAGRADLRAGVLRHVSDHFGDDPLRVLRGMQLCARFEVRPSAETLSLCARLPFEGLPRERVFEEWRKLLVLGVRPSLGLTFLRDCDWLRHHPELAALVGCHQDPAWHPEGDVWVHTQHCLDAFAEERVGDAREDLVVGLAVLCHDFGKPETTRTEGGRVTSKRHERAGETRSREFLERMTAESRLVEEVAVLVATHLRPFQLYEARAGDAAVRRLARRVGRIDRLVRVARADQRGRPPRVVERFEAGEWLLERARDLDIERSRPERIVKGRHLLALGAAPGPEIGALLDACYRAQLEGTFTTLEDGIELARTWIAEGALDRPTTR